METFQVKVEKGLSSIYVGESFKNIKNYLPDTQTVIITDKNIHHFYKDAFPDAPIITIGEGEKNKTLSTIEYIYKELIRLSCDRSSFILGIGGGIVTDIAGFAASTFLRGLDFGFVSTSLLSQVDASVGGKNGVNLDAYKNMVGVFNQPRFVICDIDMLSTLPKKEIFNGMAEIVKHGLISDANMFAFLEKSKEKALNLDLDTIFRLVRDSVRIKSRVVENDEKEAGERRKLNFGHTIGHAIEKIENAGHGRAVAMGMVMAAKFSRFKGMIADSDVQRIKRLLADLQLPIEPAYNAKNIIHAASRDKKKQGSDLFFVFLEQIGKAKVEKIGYEELNAFIRSEFE
ncbi:MAG: 3-dehydroquinate synthase [Desulfobacteraceae bacterium]|nr:3-dehydroquinate synthase [Desulfobacteraceae bacterium]